MGRLRRGLRTGEDAFRIPILRTLVEVGGSGDVSMVLDRVGTKMKSQLTKHDMEPLPSNPKEVRWRNTGKWVRNYQLVQDRVDRIVLRVVAFRRPSAVELGLFERAARERLDPSVEFEVAFVPEIALGPRGKFQVAVSRVRPGYYAQGEQRTRLAHDEGMWNLTR